MKDRKLNVTLSSPHSSVRVARREFNEHVDTCINCQPSLCWPAQVIWRNLCLIALRLHGTEPVTVLHLSQKDGA